METLLETKSIPTLLVFIAIFLCANFLKGMVEFLWKIKKKDDVARETTQNAILKEQVKIHTAINNCFFAIKSLAGAARWDKISKEIQARNSNLDS